MIQARRPSPHRLWAAVFLIWLFVLIGLPVGWGGPGALRSMHLRKLLESKGHQIEALENEISRLDAESVRFLTRRIVQEREIRRILGYAASDEMIFDFNMPDKISQN